MMSKVAGLFLALMGLVSCGASSDPESFCEEVKKAAKGGEKEMMALYDFSGVHFILQDQALVYWRHLVSSADQQGMVFDSVEWVPATEFSDGRKEALGQMSEVNGRIYKYNLEVVGECNLKWGYPDDREGSFSAPMLVGISKDGQYRFVSEMVEEAK